MTCALCPSMCMCSLILNKLTDFNKSGCNYNACTGFIAFTVLSSCHQKQEYNSVTCFKDVSYTITTVCRATKVVLCQSFAT